jgi:hypothetical protein
MHILDLLENALEAGATQVELTIDENLTADRLAIVVRDNGRGMDPDTASRAIDPFFTTRTTRHVGLGLPLFAAAARRCDGNLTLESATGQGTTVTATFRHSHIDRAPLGNMTDTLLAFLLSGRETGPDLFYGHQVNDRRFELNSAAIQAAVGDLPLSFPPVRNWLRDYITEGEADLASPQEGGNHA